MACGRRGTCHGAAEGFALCNTYNQFIHCTHQQQPLQQDASLSDDDRAYAVLLSEIMLQQTQVKTVIRHCIPECSSDTLKNRQLLQQVDCALADH